MKNKTKKENFLGAAELDALKLLLTIRQLRDSDREINLVNILDLATGAIINVHIACLCMNDGNDPLMLYSPEQIKEMEKEYWKYACVISNKWAHGG